MIDLNDKLKYAFTSPTNDNTFGISVATCEKYTLVGSINDRLVYLYSNSTGKIIHKFQSPCEQYWNVGHPLGDRLAVTKNYSLITGAMCGKTYIYDNYTGSLLHALQGRGGVVVNAYKEYAITTMTPQGVNALIVNNATGDIVYNVPCGKGAPRVGITDNCFTTSTRSDGVKLYNLTNGNIVKEFDVSTDYMDISETHLVFASEDRGSVYIYDIIKDSLDIQEMINGYIINIAVSDTYIMIGLSNSSVLLLDVLTPDNKYQMKDLSFFNSDYDCWMDVSRGYAVIGSTSKNEDVIGKALLFKLPAPFKKELNKVESIHVITDTGLKTVEKAYIITWDNTLKTKVLKEIDELNVIS